MQGTMMLTGAALKTVKVAGVAADKAVEITGKAVNVTAKVSSAALNTTGVVGEAALQTVSVGTQAAAKAAQAAATSSAQVAANTLEASTKVVKSGLNATTKITNAALSGTAQVSADTLKASADAASAGAKFSLGTVTTALNGLNNLRELGGMTGQAWVEKVRARKQENSKLGSLRAPQIVLDILVKDFEKVAGDLRSSFEDSIASNNISLKVLVVSVKDLYCMSIYRRLTKNTCPTNSAVRTGVEAKMKSQVKELDGRSKFFFKMFAQKQSNTISQFKAAAQRMPPTANEQQELAQIERIKALFTKSLDEFSGFVANQLTTLTSLFEKRSAQYQKLIDDAYQGVYSLNTITNQMPVSAPVTGGRRRTYRKKVTKSKKTRKH